MALAYLSSSANATDTDTNKSASSLPKPLTDESDTSNHLPLASAKTNDHFDSNKTRRVSTGKIAPLAPPLSQQQHQQENIVSLNALEVPTTYRKLIKSHSQNKNKRLAPIATAEFPRTEESDTDYTTVATRER